MPQWVNYGSCQVELPAVDALKRCMRGASIGGDAAARARWHDNLAAEPAELLK